MRWIRGQCVEEDRSELRQRVEQKKTRTKRGRGKRKKTKSNVSGS